jgi:hypothetical protein
MRSMRAFICSAVFVCTNILFAGAGQLINFETLPDGSTPYDGMVVSNQWASVGVTFRLGNGALPILATPGGTNWAFFGPPNSTTQNEPAVGENVGRFFLTDRTTGQPRNLIIEYSSPVSGASGVILDIDHKDAWAIEPRDSNDNILANYSVALDIDSTNAGDGVATPWSVQAPTPEIYSIRIRYTGESSMPGLAFDNFSPTNALPVPAPAQLSIGLDGSNKVLTLTGTSNALYKVEWTSTFTNWTTLTNIYLPSSSVSFSDSFNSGGRFYRAIGLQ